MTIDALSLGYVSSAGLRTLLDVAKLARSLGSSLALVVVQAPVQQVLDASGLTKANIFTLHPTVEGSEAVAHPQAGAAGNPCLRDRRPGAAVRRPRGGSRLVACAMSQTPRAGVALVHGIAQAGLALAKELRTRGYTLVVSDDQPTDAKRALADELRDELADATVRWSYLASLGLKSAP